MVLKNGSKNKAEEIAIKLLKENVDIDLICKVTSLCVEEIEKLQNKFFSN